MRVSIIIPTHNREKYIVTAIKSCLIQDEVGQVIVVDDASTDSTPILLTQITDIRLKVIKLLKKGGASASRNVGIPHVTCEFVSFLDSDDYYLPNRFTPALAYLDSHLKIHGTYQRLRNFMDEDYDGFNFEKDEYFELKEDIAPQLLFDAISSDTVSFFHFMSLVMRSTIIKDVTFDPTLRFHGDKDFICQVAKKYLLSKVNEGECTIMRRIHAGNLTHAPSEERIKVAYQYLEKWFAMLLVEDFSVIQARNIFYRKISLDYLMIFGKKPLVIRLFLKFFVFLYHVIRKPILIKKILM